MSEVFDDPTLSDPDEDGDDIKYGWDEEFQRHIISLVLCDRQFLLQSLDLIKPTYFTNKAHQKAASLVFKFFKKYRILPGKDFIVQETKSDLKDNKALSYYIGEINTLYDYFQPGLDAREYLQDKITYFAKIQSVKQAFKNSLKEIDKSPEAEETWTKIYEMMRTAMTTHQNFEVGLDYFKTIQQRYADMITDEEDKERFATGLESIDKNINGGGYGRGEIISFVAGSGVGKSVMLACLAATNLLRGKKGVYISLELAEAKVADRMDSILTGFPVQNLYGHRESIFEELANLEGVDYESKMPLVIKQFPSGTATVNTIRAYVSQLRFHGFDPDFVIVDYVGEMADMPGMKTYESREKTIRDLRALAIEENVFVATAMQPNRGSKEAQKSQGGKLDEEHLADSFGQIRPLDGCFSIMQNDGEKLLGIGRLYVMKQRDGLSRYQIYLGFNKQNLKITEIAQQTYMQLLNSHKESVIDDVQMDHIIKPFAPQDDEVLPAVED
jgi:replicative DNA helicase